MPSVEQARERLQTELRSARQSGVKVLKLVHGYGSSGIGGDLRFSLQSTLRQMAQQHEIGDCIYGENWRTSDQRTWNLLKRMPELKSDSDLGKGNKGMTIVVL
jgi:Smr domain